MRQWGNDAVRVNLCVVYISASVFRQRVYLGEFFKQARRRAGAQEKNARSAARTNGSIFRIYKLAQRLFYTLEII